MSFRKLLFLCLALLPASAFADRFGSIKSGADVPLSTQTVKNQNTLQTGTTFYVSSATVKGQFIVEAFPDPSFGGAFSTNSRFTFLPSGNSSTRGSLYYLGDGGGSNTAFVLGVSGYTPGQQYFDPGEGTYNSSWYMTGGGSGVALRFSHSLDLWTFGSSVTIPQMNYAGYDWSTTAPGVQGSLWGWTGNRWGPLTPVSTYYAGAETMSFRNNTSTNTSFYSAFSTNPYFGSVKFSGTASSATNSAVFGTLLQQNVSTNAICRIWITSLSSAADTGSFRYGVSLAQSADGDEFDAPTFTTTINVDMAANGSHTVGKVHISSAALTGWPALFTKEKYLHIQVKRAGSDTTNDTSTMDSYVPHILFEYGKTSVLPPQ